MVYEAELKKISKRYDNRWANRGVDLSIQHGTIHGLVGENGAGKSTAMKILFGMIAPDEGTVVYKGQARPHWSPRLAFQSGIGMVHQHFMLAGPETALDNLVLGVEKTHFGFRKRKLETLLLEKLMTETGLQIDLNKPVRDLPISHQSRCEILKVLYRNASLLILDEPTAVLTPQETDGFLQTLLKLKSQGKTILIVTHKLQEIMNVADEATVLRNGEVIASRQIKDTSVHELAELMIGRKLSLPQNTVKHQSTSVEMRVPTFGIEVKGGEIVGIAGVEGNGQDQLIHDFLYPSDQEGPSTWRRKPIAVIPPDRHRDAVVLTMSLSENLALGRVQALHKGYQIFKQQDKAAQDFLKSKDVRPADPSALMQQLSGGNQQKLVVARELYGCTPAPRAILAVHPTRGIDLGAIEQIHNDLIEQAQAGAGILLISSELEELMNLSHRIGVLHHGRIVAWFDRASTGPGFDEKPIGLAMTTGLAT